MSNINFRAGFSTQPSLDLNHTIEWPLQGTVLLELPSGGTGSPLGNGGSPGDPTVSVGAAILPQHSELSPRASTLSLGLSPGDTGTTTFRTGIPASEGLQDLMLSLLLLSSHLPLSLYQNSFVYNPTSSVFQRTSVSSNKLVGTSELIASGNRRTGSYSEKGMSWWTFRCPRG